MKVLAFLSYFIFVSTSYSFTLLSENPPRYTAEKVIIDAANDDCSNAGVTADELLNLAMDAMDLYWHKVPTSRLRFEKGTVRDFSNASATLSDFLTTRGEVNKIIVSCSTVGFSSTTLGLGTIGSAGGVAAGAFYLGDNSTVAALTREEKMAVIAHEIGHAIGLSHSNDPVALMFFSVSGKVQVDLTRDDHDGVTYLYPNEKKAGGCFGSLGTISTDGDNDPGGNGMALGILSLFFLLALRYKNRLKNIPLKSHVPAV